MRLSLFPVFFFIVAPLYAFAQIPYYTIPDTAEMRAMREKKIQIEYTLEQPFDSVTGKLKTKAPFDTIYSIYDREGRQLDFSYMNEDGTRAHSTNYYDKQGRIVRHFSYDGDSTNGYVHYWTYNAKGEVVRDVSCSREGAHETPFHVEKFIYDDSGKLVVQKSYSVDDDGSETMGDFRHFYYRPNNMVIEVGLRVSGDTSYVDTTMNADGPGDYYSHRYVYRRKHILVSSSNRSVDSLGARVKTTYVSNFYSYTDGKPDHSYTDTTYSDRHGNILESYDKTHIDKFFYDDNGEFEYMIRYNRRQQPLYRRTRSYVHYQ